MSMVSRVIDVLNFSTLKVIDVLTLLGHRCPEPYQVSSILGGRVGAAAKPPLLWRLAITKPRIWSA
ncbi:MAG: hypothetical protein JRF46_16680 [Deltaproteobacteria bacterium]|nr:hypothetical protein [Deltaproteobacteria bacterium]